MCASYGLQVRVDEVHDHFQFDERVQLGEIADWLERFAADTVKPTGRIERKLNPIVREGPDGRVADLAWWGFLVGGIPAKWPSINTRSERLHDRPASAKSRVLVPATQWFEYAKPSKQKWSFSTGELFAIAAVAQPGRPTDGDAVTCYSIVTQPARADLEHIHDRMPLVLPQSFFADWLNPLQPLTTVLLDAAVDAGHSVTGRIVSRPV